MTLLSVRVPSVFADEIDNAAKRLQAERPPGSDVVTRSEIVKIALNDWLARHSDGKPKRSK